MNIFFKKRNIAVLQLCFCFFCTLAKKTSELDPNTFIFDRQWRIGLTAALYDNLELTHNGESWLKSAPTISYELSLSYYHELGEKLGFNIGLGLSTASYNANFSFEVPEEYIFWPKSYDDYRHIALKHHEYIHHIYTFPVSIQKLIEKKHNQYYSIELGSKLNRLINFPYTVSAEAAMMVDDNGNSVTFYNENIESIGRQNFFSYFMKIGLVKINRKVNTLHYNMVLHWSPKKIGKGTYDFPNFGDDNHGTITHNVNYIGFEVSYGFTRSYTLKDRL